MRPQILSWLRETGRLTVRYIFVGFAFVPAGLLYVGLEQIGWASVASMSLCLAFGFLMANVVWERSATMGALPEPVLSQGLAAALAGPRVQGWAVDVNIMRAPELAFTQAGSWETGRQSVVISLWSNAVSTRQIDFTSKAGAAHAAFSGTPC
jgi:hypothetical protein